MKYDLPIQSDEHAKWCLDEAERRHGGHIIRDEHGMFLVYNMRDGSHTDAVLRALSFYELNGKPQKITAWAFDEWILRFEDAFGMGVEKKLYRKWVKKRLIQAVRFRGNRYVVDDPREWARHCADYGI